MPIDALTLILISLLFLIFLTLFLYFNERSSTENKIIQEEIKNLVQTMHENIGKQIDSFERFTMAFRFSPGYRGQVGEGIVRMALSQIPREYVDEQWHSSHIDGRPDFAVRFPDIPERLIIDAKLTVPENFDHDEKTIKELNRKVKKRAEEIKKYIVPGVTFPFVLMWIPDYTYSNLSNETLEELRIMRIIPCPSSSLLAIVFLMQRLYQIARINAEAQAIEKVYQELEKVQMEAEDFLRKAKTQQINSTKNLEKLEQALTKFSSSMAKLIQS